MAQEERFSQDGSKQSPVQPGAPLQGAYHAAVVYLRDVGRGLLYFSPKCGFTKVFLQTYVCIFPWVYTCVCTYIPPSGPYEISLILEFKSGRRPLQCDIPKEKALALPLAVGQAPF